MIGKPLLSFRDDKLYEIVGLMTLSSGAILISRPALSAVESGMLAAAFKGSIGEIFFFSTMLILALFMLFVIVIMFRETFNDKSLRVFSEGFSFFDDDLRSRIDLKWEALDRVQLVCEKHYKSSRNVLELGAQEQRYKIFLDCLTDNPEDISDRMKLVYRYWRSGSFSQPDFKLPYHPNKLRKRQLFYYTVLMLLCVFIVFSCVQSSEIVVHYDEIRFSFAGMSRTLLLSGASVGFISILGQFLDHFDTRDNEDQYQVFKQYSTITACLMFHVALVSCEMTF